MAISSKIKKGQVIVLSVITIVGVCLVVAGGVGYGAYAKWHDSGKIASHYFVQGEDIGGLTPIVAMQRLQNRFGRLFVTIHVPGRDFKLSLSQLGGGLQDGYVVHQAYQYGRNGNLIANLWHFWFSTKKEKRKALPWSWDEDKLRRAMWTVAGIYNQKPRDAYLEIKNGKAQVVAEQLGRTLDVPEAIDTIQQKYFPGLAEVDVPAETKEPKIREADLQGNDVILGKYTTTFNPAVRGRTTNVRLAAAAVDGKVLMPGETFSLNKSTGERTPAKGYRVAKIYVKKTGEVKAEVVDGVGGGVCQVSSTLYNAVRRANEKSSGRLKIVQREHHSLPVHYVPPGLDATVAWPYKDFRFRNDYSFPVYMHTEVAGSKLIISVWGRVPDSDSSQYSASLNVDEGSG